MSFENWMIYTTVIFISTILPGPSVLLALSHGVRYGRKRSMFTASGVTLAAVIMATVSAIGLGAIIVSSGFAFLAIKYLGAAYLIYIGVKCWFQKLVKTQSLEDTADLVKKTPGRIFFQALFVGLGNPKAIIFFTALFPQFVHSSEIQVYNFMVLIVTLAAVVFICMMIWSIGGVFIMAHLYRDRLHKLFNRILGSLFIGFGAGLVFSNR